MRLMILPLLVVSVVLAGTILADEVKLKEGRVVKGLIISDDGKKVKIQTPEGKTEIITHDKIDSVAESAEIGNPEIDAKLAAIDTESASALSEVGKWAKEAGQKGWKLVAQMALRRDKDNDTAHELLDHIKVGESWYPNKEDADRAKRELNAKKFAEEGYLKHKDGWIKKEDKTLADKDPNNYLKDDNGVYRQKAEVMKERGMTMVGGKWIKAGTEDDRKEITRFKELMGDDIWVITTKHFRIFAQQYPPEKVDEFGVLVEKVYDWFVKEMGKPPEFQVFRGNKGLMWILKDKNTALEWYKHYHTKYSIDVGAKGKEEKAGSEGSNKGSFLTLLERGGGNIHSDGILISITVPNQSEDIRNQLVHVAGHFCINWFAPGLGGGGGTESKWNTAWLDEAFAHQSEHVLLGNGIINCSTLAFYANQGGVAEKKFTTKDAHERAKALVREGSDEPFVNLAKLGLNELNGDHLTKGWTVVEWLLKNHHDKFVSWLESMNNAPVDQALSKTFEGWDTGKLDAEWTGHVKKNF